MIFGWHTWLTIAWLIIFTLYNQAAWQLNNTPTLFPFVYDILTPELLTPDGQALHPQKLIHREITTGSCNGIGIPPKRIVVRSIIAKLSWQNNWLQLQVIIFDSPKVPIDSDKSWFFEPIEPI